MEKRKKLIIVIENFEIVKEKFKEKGSKETRKQEEKKNQHAATTNAPLNVIIF